MPSPRREPQAGDLSGARVERTLRDVLHELPVDALVPAGWRVGTEVLQFGDRLPADGVTLQHPDYSRDLVITPAGTRGDEALALYERDRVAGRRTAVAGVPATGDDRAELDAALRAAARVAARIETKSARGAAIDEADPAASLSGEDGHRRVHFY